MARTDKDDLISIIDEDDHHDEIPTRLPLLPVRDVVIFTDMLLPLFVGRDKSVRALEEAMGKDRFLMVVTQEDPSEEHPQPQDIFEIGTVCRILRMLKLPDGRVKALVQGLEKAAIKKYVRRKYLFRVDIELLPEAEVKEQNLELEALMRNVRENSEKILALRGELSGDVSAILDSIDHPGKLADLVASNLRLKINEAQMLLELTDPTQRLKKVNDLLSKEVELSAVQAKIQSDVKDEISKTQRDYFLREQVRAIHRELGELDDKVKELEDYQNRIKRARMPKGVKQEALKQVRRLEQMHPESAETAVVRTYLDWLVEMPWKKKTRDVIDIKRAKRVLDRDHHGLAKVKDRILEYLSVRKLNPKTKGPILCFVGPPGVGKTSLGQAIARAMGRKFVRISLGGIRDEAEIRGHRRTYIGSMPGRILQGLKQCGSNNPVFMMDEIDKLGADYKGDPSSALLEALDPEQNFAFSDHYLNLPFDLSRVMFILTANVTDPIPSALLDRMEVIYLSGYTEEEKQTIADKHLLPRQIKENGLKKKTLTISQQAMHQIIREYTSEAGLRNLERELGTLCRKVARRIAEGTKGRFKVTRGNLHTYLGPPKYIPEMDQEPSQIGLATGLAWTHVGGEVLYIEATLIKGKGELIITGQLGEVMQESARAALSYIRSNLGRFGMKRDRLDNRDIHLHVPAGAIPKDGPSAGVAMATALISVLTQKPVDNRVAMTGEITIRGRVLPIGGLKEKALGAIRAGIKTLILPAKNRKDLTELPPHIRRRLRFVAVEDMDAILPLVFDPWPPAQRAKKGSRSTTARRR